MWKFAITDPVVTHKEQEEKGEVDRNVENTEVCKVVGKDGCGDKDEDNNMVATGSFSSFGKTEENWIEEEGKMSSVPPPRSEVVM